MKNTKIKGFSLAEVMIAMVVVSIALAAAMPTITKRNAGSDSIWRVGTQKTGGEVTEDSKTIAFSGPNILIGTSRLPLLSNSYFADENFDDGLKIHPKDDKLIIFNKFDSDSERFKSSHIGFYNSPTEYAGRLALDKYNVALGIGSLQSLQPDYTANQGKYNTAIGQYALLTNDKGSYNLAFGYNALRGNSVGAVSGNIALGDNTLMNVEDGSDNNIAIGSSAGKNLTGSNNIVIGANAGKNLTGSDNILITTIDGSPTADLKELLRGSRDENKYPLIGDNGNFAIGILNNEKEGKLLPPIMQGFTTIETCSSGTGCADGVLYAKGLVINADTFNINTKEGKTIFSVRENSGDSAPMDIASATKAPCNGAPICLAKFNVTTASLYTTQEKDDWLGNTWVRKSSYPRFKDATTNNTGLYPNPVYDLYIGSIFASDSDFEKENSKVVGKSTSHDFTNYSKNLIDVGKEETTDGLTLSRLSDSVAKDGTVIKNVADASRPAVLNSHGSLKIRTVKTAVNFLDEMKEKSGLWDRIRDNVDYNLQALFSYPENTEDSLKYSPNCNTSGVKSDWESIKSCDPNYYKKEGKDLLAGFCEGVWERRAERAEFKNKYEQCRNGGNGIIYCLLQTLGETIQDAIEENNAAAEYASQQCAGKVIGWLTCYIDAKKNYVPPTPETSDATTDETTSDARLKNISGDNTAGLKEINKLQVYNYTYKADKAQTPHVGVMAQDLKKVFPNAVKKGSDGYYRIRLEDMFYAMINSVKELSKKKDELNALTVDYIDAPLSELEKQNSDIKAQNEMLKQKNAEIEKRLSQMEAK